MLGTSMLNKSTFQEERSKQPRQNKDEKKAKAAPMLLSGASKCLSCTTLLAINFGWFPFLHTGQTGLVEGKHCLFLLFSQDQ